MRWLTQQISENIDNLLQISFSPFTEFWIHKKKENFISFIVLKFPPSPALQANSFLRVNSINKTHIFSNKRNTKISDE